MSDIINRFAPDKRCDFFLFLAIIYLVIPLSCSAQGPPEAGTPPPPPGPAAEEEIAAVSEYVKIDGKKYEVPPPYTGQRIHPPVLTFESFKKIPVKHTYNGTSVYVLAEAQPHLVAMLSAAEEDGVHIEVESGYRSENYQRDIFVRMMKKGRTFEDIVRYVAPPGYSQHVLGIAVDFHPSNWRFADTPQYAWLRENAQRFDFEETYSQYNQYKMPWESWHWSYTGNGERADSAAP